MHRLDDSEWWNKFRNQKDGYDQYLIGPTYKGVYVPASHGHQAYNLNNSHYDHPVYNWPMYQTKTH